MIDMYARTTVDLVPGPIDAAAVDRLKAAAAAAPQSLIVVQLPGRANDLAQHIGHWFGWRRVPGSLSQPPWAAAAHLRPVKTYSLPNGRRYAVLEWRP